MSFNLRALLIVVGVASLYFIFSVLLLNFKVLSDINTFDDKVLVAVTLVTGVVGAFGWGVVILNLIIGVLLGWNVYLLTSRLEGLKSGGGTRVMVGGAMVLGLGSVSCGVCGVSIFALIGIGSVGLLPMRGVELSFIAIGMLLASIFILTRKNVENACRIK